MESGDDFPKNTSDNIQFKKGTEMSQALTKWKNDLRIFKMI